MTELAINNYIIPIREYNGQRVITFKDIDMVHERPEGTARKRFNDNKKHFIEGVDYFVRKTDEAANEFGIIAPNGLVLITESGYLMLVKSFTDDLAWKVQRELVNSYFKVQNLFIDMNTANQYITLCENELRELKATVSVLQNQVLTLSPVLNQKKINIWKSKFIKPGIAMLVQKYEIDERSAYDLVYDRMSSRYGFDRSCAINEFCDKYKTEICYVTDAIADYEPYRKYFMDCVYELLGSNALKLAAKKVDLQKVKYNEMFNNLLNSLVNKCNDKTVCGIGTLGKVYKTMMSDSDWKKMMSQKHCYSKKQLILNDGNLFDNFRSVALNMLGGAEM